MCEAAPAAIMLALSLARDRLLELSPPATIDVINKGVSLMQQKEGFLIIVYQNEVKRGQKVSEMGQKASEMGDFRQGIAGGVCACMGAAIHPPGGPLS